MMRKTTLKTLLLTLLLWTIIWASVAAQPTGFPAGSHASGRFSVTAVAALAKHDFEPFGFRLPAYVVKAAYGLTSWFDVALVAGAVDLQADLVEKDRTWWSAGYKPTVGFGVWLDPLRLGPLSTFSAATALGYLSDGASYKEEVTAGQRRVFWDATEQRVLEVLLAGGLALQVSSARVYAGAGISRWWRRVEIRQEVRRGSQRSVLGQSTDMYQGQPVVRPVAGVQLDLPHRLFLSIEASGESSGDFWIAVGLGQTGSPD